MGWALVTGASSGMGLEYSRQLASRGWDIVLVSNQENELVQAAADIAGFFGVNAVPHYADLSAENAAGELLDWCRCEGYEIEVLVNNAGMFFFKELGPGDMGRVGTMMNLHMKAVTEMCILFGAEMKVRGHGSILIMSSMASLLPAPGIAIYSATKAYLRSFGKSLFFEMRPYGVGVTTVCPAAIATPLYRLKPSLMELGVRVGVIKTPEWLVRRALNCLFKKKSTCRPGFMNVWMPPALALLPKGIESRIWKKLK